MWFQIIKERMVLLQAIKTQTLYDLSHTIAAELLARTEFPWEALPQIHDFLLALGQTLPADRFDHPQEDVWIARSATVARTASISGPCIIDENAEIRHCAFIRGNALVGKGCVVGNSTELKNVILFDRVQVPHYNYVGDSILGFASHLGAGAITSNVKSDKTPVSVGLGESRILTGLKKMGAMVGDFVEVGCNSVLNPGTVIGRNTNVYPTSCVRGILPANHIYKDQNTIVPKCPKNG